MSVSIAEVIAVPVLPPSHCFMKPEKHLFGKFSLPFSLSLKEVKHFVILILLLYYFNEVIEYPVNFLSEAN